MRVCARLPHPINSWDPALKGNAAQSSIVAQKLAINVDGGWRFIDDGAAEAPFDQSHVGSTLSIKARLEFRICDESMVLHDLIEAIYPPPGVTYTMKRITCHREIEIQRPNMIAVGRYRLIKVRHLSSDHRSLIRRASRSVT
jgi:hypothetical protein